MTATCKLGEKGCWNDGKCRATSNCENKVITNADRMIEILKTNDAASLLDWWEEIFEIEQLLKKEE